MQTITGINVNEVYPVGLLQLQHGAVLQKSQHGDTLEMPDPVSVKYLNPRERCLFDPVRDSNPFLNLFEALWILAGREDVKFLEEIVGRMATYADDGEKYFGAYGARMRGTSSFLDRPVEEKETEEERWVHVGDTHDQIEVAIHRLTKNHNDRQVVLQIRQPSDIAYFGKDQPCNMAVSLKIRNNKLNIHVFNRSNDFIWGLAGTNVVQFSMLQEYLAGRIGVEVGVYHQTTDSMHVYVNDQYRNIINHTSLGFTATDYYAQGVTKPYPMYSEGFDDDLRAFFQQYDQNSGMGISRLHWKTGFFSDLVFPAWYSFLAYKDFRDNKRAESLDEAKRLADQVPADWGVMIRGWLSRRGEK